MQTASRFPASERGQYGVHLAWLHVAAALALHQPFKAAYVLCLAGRAVECQEQSSQWHRLLNMHGSGSLFRQRPLRKLI